MQILILNGPNLNLIGNRETQIYGNTTFEAFFDQLKQEKSIDLIQEQSNEEGVLINILQNTTADAVVLNAGGYTHTSVALRDCIKAIHTPVIEVHISNIAARESFRHESLLSPVVEGCIFGFGLNGYALAVDFCLNYLNKR
jgi:3-dehydroquinate dehydratase-2